MFCCFLSSFFRYDHMSDIVYKIVHLIIYIVVYCVSCSVSYIIEFACIIYIKLYNIIHHNIVCHFVYHIFVISNKLCVSSTSYSSIFSIKYVVDMINNYTMWVMLCLNMIKAICEVPDCTEFSVQSWFTCRIGLVLCFSLLTVLPFTKLSVYIISIVTQKPLLERERVGCTVSGPAEIHWGIGLDGLTS